jgi:hypothetical protein
MTATPAIITIETFINATVDAVRSGNQARHVRAGAEAMVHLTRNGQFSAEYLAALASGIRIGLNAR